MNVVNHWKNAIQALSEKDEVIKKIISNYRGECMELRGNGFITLARSIVGQQISVKAADTVWKRLEIKCNKTVDAETILSLSTLELKNIGLSKQKVNYMQNIAKTNIFDTKWAQKTDDEAIDILCTIKGIGKWTAEMFLIFHLARPNILPLGDVGLIKGIEKHYNNGEKMEKDEIIKLKELWNPWCSVFTWYIWRSLDPIPVNY
jgi:DNA-3-methyladenine glycosylase II|tara:strand:- start:1153 stop:1764 length:612 start_codon:yes stop_codon:yes gene_type:complete